MSLSGSVQASKGKDSEGDVSTMLLRNVLWNTLGT
jgi:hypothetical protein